MLETKQTSHQLVNEAAVVRGGRPLLISLIVIVWSAANVSANAGDPLETPPWVKSEGWSDGAQRFIAWLSSFWDFALQSSTELGVDSQWSGVSPAELNAGEVRVPVETSSGQQFYRVVESFPDQASP